MTLKKKAFKNIEVKGENAGNQHFLLVPHCFSIVSRRSFMILATCNLSSSNASNLDKSKTLSFGKELYPVLREGLIFIVNPLTDNKILDWSKLKEIADDILKCN